MNLDQYRVVALAVTAVTARNTRRVTTPSQRIAAVAGCST
jgi:hypothetical protein